MNPDDIPDDRVAAETTATSTAVMAEPQELTVADAPPAADPAADGSQESAGAPEQETALPSTHIELFGAVSALPDLLPGDPSGSDFAQAVRALRPNFEERLSYNAMICDQLAMRGQAPNASLVLAIGAWGSKKAVIEDVQAWYVSLSARLAAHHARIPESTRRQANELLESMWTLAMQATTRPLDEAQKQAAETLALLEASRAAFQELEATHEAAVLAMQAEIQAAQDKLASNQMLVSSLEADAEAMRASVVQRAIEHRTELLTQASDLRQRHEEELKTLRALTDARLAEQAEKLSQMEERSQRQLSESQALLNEATQRERELMRANALTMDRARQDVKEANERADRERAKVDGLQAQLGDQREAMSQLHVEMARLEKLLVDEKARAQALEVALTQASASDSASPGE